MFSAVTRLLLCGEWLSKRNVLGQIRILAPIDLVEYSKQCTITWPSLWANVSNSFKIALAISILGLVITSGLEVLLFISGI